MVYIGVITHLYTILLLTSWDIQVSYAKPKSIRDLLQYKSLHMYYCKNCLQTSWPSQVQVSVSTIILVLEIHVDLKVWTQTCHFLRNQFDPDSQWFWGEEDLRTTPASSFNDDSKLFSSKKSHV